MCGGEDKAAPGGLLYYLPPLEVPELALIMAVSSRVLLALAFAALIAAPSAVLGCMWVYGTAPDGLVSASS